MFSLPSFLPATAAAVLSRVVVGFPSSQHVLRTSSLQTSAFVPGSYRRLHSQVAYWNRKHAELGIKPRKHRSSEWVEKKRELKEAASRSEAGSVGSSEGLPSSGGVNTASAFPVGTAADSVARPSGVAAAATGSISGGGGRETINRKAAGDSGNRPQQGIISAPVPRAAGPGLPAGGGGGGSETSNGGGSAAAEDKTRQLVAAVAAAVSAAAAAAAAAPAPAPVREYVFPPDLRMGYAAPPVVAAATSTAAAPPPAPALPLPPPSLASPAVNPSSGTPGTVAVTATSGDSSKGVDPDKASTPDQRQPAAASVAPMTVVEKKPVHLARAKASTAVEAKKAADLAKVSKQTREQAAGRPAAEAKKGWDDSMSASKPDQRQPPVLPSVEPNATAVSPSNTSAQARKQPAVPAAAEVNASKSGQRQPPVLSSGDPTVVAPSKVLPQAQQQPAVPAATEPRKSFDGSPSSSTSDQPQPLAGLSGEPKATVAPSTQSQPALPTAAEAKIAAEAPVPEQRQPAAAATAAVREPTKPTDSPMTLPSVQQRPPLPPSAAAVTLAVFSSSSSPTTPSRAEAAAMSAQSETPLEGARKTGPPTPLASSGSKPVETVK